ncbi:MAG TPA: winged helix-turn-helix domain-containing protein [Candidatus Sulfotelmatobacter sp.]|nr:winged helix-turn-helix domain-containing protein [Candidatus Sulfotelmatobacter sp.]
MGNGRSPAPEEPPIWFDGWVILPDSMQLRSEDGALEHLTEVEYRILILLARNPRRVVTRDQLAVVAGRPLHLHDRSIDVHISNLRRKLDRDTSLPSVIRTMRGAGYMFVPNCERALR